ncbi:MAG: AAA family ATPase [Acidobacteriota bacterium]
MYERYYGLQERPFELSPNPRFLFLSNKHREALTHLQYGLGGRPGLTVLTGDAGTGKSMLVRTALHSSTRSNAGIVQLSNPTLTRAEFFEHLADGFGFAADTALSKTRFLRALESAIASRARENAVLALVVDEAQSLSFELLEEIRLLTNIEGAPGRSLAVVLVGQPELSARLNDPSLRQLKQRVSLRCELAPLEFRETAAYITERVRVAGGNAESLFTRDAVIAIHEHSKGIPRTISVICDNSLVSGLAADKKPVGRDVVVEVCRDFHFGPVESVVPVPSIPLVQPGPAAVETPTDTGAARRQARRPARTVKAEAVPDDNKSDPDQTPSDDSDSRHGLFSGFTRRRRFSFF